MPSKLEAFLADKKIDRRQLLAVSKDLEALRPEDRTLRLAKRNGAKSEDDKKVKETRKPRSGKPITPAALVKILAGKPISGPTKTRLLRAVNAILERKKQTKVDLGTIFDLATQAVAKRKPKVVKDKKR
ncbi:MAG: hypothetical protein NVS3B10_15080 [Polyangiales bacterium]